MEEKTRSIVSALISGFAVVLVLGFFNGFTWGLYNDWQVYHDLTVWKAVPGQIESIGVAGHYDTARSSSGMHYSAYCTYKYTVDGKSYEGGSYRLPSVQHGDPDAAMAEIASDLHLQNPVWQREGWGITFEAHMLTAAGIPVEVHYYPPDPSVTFLVNAGGDHSQGGAMIGFGIVSFVIDLGVLFGLWSWLDDRKKDRRRQRQKAAEPHIPVSAAICDAFVPLLDEGIAAAQALTTGAKADLRMDMERLVKEFQDMREKAAGHRLGMDHSSLSLGRRFDWEPADDRKPECRFIYAIRKIDDFYYNNLVVKEHSPPHGKTMP